MHITTLPQKVGWLGGKEIDFRPWDSKIYFHK
jgi:hypothetical protein